MKTLESKGVFTSKIKIWVVSIMLIDNYLLQKQCEKQWNGMESFFFILLIFVYLMPMHCMKWETKELHHFLHFDHRLLDHYWNLILLEASLLTMIFPLDCALCVRLYVERYTYALVVILLYAQHHALKGTTQKRHYYKVNHSKVRDKGTHKNQAPQRETQGDSQKSSTLKRDRQGDSRIEPN